MSDQQFHNKRMAEIESRRHPNMETVAEKIANGIVHLFNGSSMAISSYQCIRSLVIETLSASLAESQPPSPDFSEVAAERITAYVWHMRKQLDNPILPKRMHEIIRDAYLEQIPTGPEKAE